LFKIYPYCVRKWDLGGSKITELQESEIILFLLYLYFPRLLFQEFQVSAVDRIQMSINTYC